MRDKVLRCQDCYNKFIFTVRQQQRYRQNGWKDPIRCPSCRARKKEILMIYKRFDAQRTTQEELFSFETDKKPAESPFYRTEERLSYS